MCVEFHDILTCYLLQNHQKQIFKFETLPWQQYYRYQYSLHSFTSAVFDIILMKFEANRLKIRCWIQSILKMTHFLLPVGGAITLTPNSHIYALGIIQRTKPWSLIKIRQCMWMLLDASCLSFFHKFIASPRANRSRYQKYPGNFASPMSWDHVHRVWWQSGGNLQRSISNSRAWFFKQPWIADFLLGGAYDMQCEICSAQWDLYVYRVYMNTCKYVWAIHQVFNCVLGGAVEPLCHARVPASVRPDANRFQRVCEFSRVFEHVKAPKSARMVE